MCAAGGYLKISGFPFRVHYLYVSIACIEAQSLSALREAVHTVLSHLLRCLRPWTWSKLLSRLQQL